MNHRPEETLDPADGSAAGAVAHRAVDDAIAQMMAPAPTNIVCFSHRPPGADEPALKAFSTEIMLRLQRG